MSQAGGPNSAGSVNIDFTGNVAPLEQAAKKAEAAVQQSAAKMQADITAAAATASQVANAAGGTSGVSSGFGVFGGNTFSPSSPSGGRGGGIINNLVGGAKSAMAPLNALFSVLSRLGFVFALVSAGATGFYAALTSGARATERSRAELAKLSAGIDDLYSKFKTNTEKSPAEIEAEGLAEVEKLRAKADAEAFARFKSGELKAKDLVKFREQNEAAAETAAANVRRNFQQLKNAEEAKSMMAQQARDEKAAQDREDLQARIAGGYAEVYMNAENEVRRASETLTGDSLQVRLEAIAFERDEKIKAMAEADKKIADNAIEQERRVDRERRRLMADFYRDLRAQQTQGTEVSGFGAGNLSQSLDLLSRQRSAVEGMSINYGGD